MEKITKHYPNEKIIGHGLVDERFELDIRFCKNIYEQINVLNNSLFLISSPSGFVDLALMCGCDVFLTEKYNKICNYNPHGCFIMEDIENESFNLWS